MKNRTSQEAYYQRLRNLAEVNKVSLKESQNRTLGTLIDFKKAEDGVAYGIIKENHNYYIKKGSRKLNPDVTDFTYIGGLSNITTFQYNTLAEADKNRNMLLSTINEGLSSKMNPNGGKKRLTEMVEDAGSEIEAAEEKFPELDAATAAEKSPEAEINAGFDSEPMAGEEMPVDGGEAPEGGEEMGGEEAPEGGEGMGGEEVPEEIKELEESIGKITEKLRKTELEPAQVKSFVNSFLAAFKDKFPDIEIEDRKDMANRILKVVPPEDVEALGDDMPQEEEQMAEEQQCSECGSFAQYAESRGYDSAESLMECGEEEVTNLVSGYANAHSEGTNNGDHENVALVIKIINPAMLDTLKNDYGHDEYSEKLTPYVDSMNESSDEDNIAKLNELFGGLKKLGASAANVVGGAVKQGANAVGSAVNTVGDKAKEVGTNISQTYHSGEVQGEVKKLEKIANNLGTQVAALNKRLEKAGQQPVDTNKILAGITNQLRGNKSASVSGTKAGAGLAAESTDPATVDVQPPTEPTMGFAKESQSLGVMSESELKIRKYVRQRLMEITGLKKSKINESAKSPSLKKLDEMIDRQFQGFNSKLTEKKNLKK